MAHSAPIEIWCRGLGRIVTEDIFRACNQANAVQHSVVFRVGEPAPPIPEETYRMPNGTYDLDQYVRDNRTLLGPQRPQILLTNLAYGDPDDPDDPDGYFADFDDEISVISLYLWKKLLPESPTTQYLLFMLATRMIIAEQGVLHLPFHDQTRGCLMDYCDSPSDITSILQAGPFCSECWAMVGQGVRDHWLHVEYVADAIRVFQVASGRKSCFVAMPFEGFEAVYRTVKRTLEKLEWTVVRADDRAVPRNIMTRIILQILGADVILADVSGSNPNVVFEFGYAIGKGRDVLLLTRQLPLPFDYYNHQAVKYSTDTAGLRRLAGDLKTRLGPGTA